MRKNFTLFIKSLFLLCLVCVTFKMQAQVVFQEDFDGVSGVTSGGPGTYAFPSGWSIFNVDGLTPAVNVSYVNAGWIRRDDFKYNTVDSCAFSGSWYVPMGKADDWMFTPAIGPLPASCILKWNAVVYDDQYPDGYEVRIMTEAPTAENILTSTVLFTQPAENATWTARQISLTAYQGMTVYIAFRNISDDKFLLAIDDITVESQIDTDISLKSVGRLSQYTMIPTQQVAPVVLQDDIKNEGSLAVTNVQLKVKVYDDADNLVHTASSEVVPSLAPGAQQYFTAGSWTPVNAGKYHVAYFPVMTETDEVVSNDTLVDNIEITDTTYARDGGNIEGNLGIGAGTGGFLGQQFTIVNNTDLRSVSYFINRGYTGEKTACAIWSMNAGKPDVMIAVTDTILYPDDSARLYTVPISGGSISLTPGEYVFTVIEFDSTLSLAQTGVVFTPGTVWVSWPSQQWANIESFGSSFTKSFFIRPNMYMCSEILSDEIIIGATCSDCPDGSINVVASGGSGLYSYLWNTSETTPEISGLLPGNYTLKISDAMNCIAENIYTVLNTVGVEENSISGFTVTPNPNNGQFIVSSVSELPGNVAIDIFNLTGEKVYSSTCQSSFILKDTIDLSANAPGMYIIRISSVNYTRFLKVIVQ